MNYKSVYVLDHNDQWVFKSSNIMEKYAVGQASRLVDKQGYRCAQVRDSMGNVLRTILPLGVK